MKKILPCLYCLLCSLSLFAQRNCRQDDYQHLIAQLYPFVPGSYHLVDSFIHIRPFPHTTQPKPDTLSTPAAPPVTPVPERIQIPVVVHVLWNNGGQNVSDAQILSQIDVLSKDYSGQNSDRTKIPSYFSALAADCGISFALAKTDPQGKPTNGIVRKQTNIGIFSFDDKAKSTALGGDDPWDAGSYLNIWVCNLETGISGYASAPGGPAAKDGVVISTSVFGTINIGGPFNKGRTATHEIGHWLSLRHIWGDAACGDDQVNDTPTQQAANRGCNSGEKFTCGSTAHGDMYMNYMDFSDDACMYMFTKGQRDRMRVLFENGGPRRSLLFSNGLKGDGLRDSSSATITRSSETLVLYPNPATSALTIQLNDNGSSIGKKMFIYNQLGQIVKTIGCISKQEHLDISGFYPGIYFLKIEGSVSGSMKKFIKQ